MSTYILTGKHHLNDSTFQIDMRPENLSDKFNFHPGQYATISFARGRRRSVVRCFSIVTAPNINGNISFAVKVYGRLTESLANMPIGQICNLQGPFGNFVYDREYDKEAVMFAAGIGVTPLLSMIRFASEQRLPNKLELYYSVRNARQTVFAAELIELSRRNPNFKLHFYVSSGDIGDLPTSLTNKGKITSQTISTAVSQSTNSPSFFICGPARFMRQVDEMLQADGVSSHQIFTESFAQNSVINFKDGPLLAQLPGIYKYATVGFAVIFGIIMVSDLANTVEPAAATSPTTSNQSTTNVLNDTSEIDDSSSEVTPTPQPAVSQPVVTPSNNTSAKTTKTLPRTKAS